MHRETVAMILRDRGREPWEVHVLVAFLEESGVLSALPGDADHEDIDEAARVVLSRGAMSPDELKRLIGFARAQRLRRKRNHLESLVESLTLEQDEFTHAEIKDRAEHLATVESQIARVGVPPDLVVPVAGLLQAADCTVSAVDSPQQVRTAIHHAAKCLLASAPDYPA